MKKVIIVANPKSGNLEYFTKERLERELPKIKWRPEMVIEIDDRRT